ncbi:MAG: hypothetical protein JSR79_07515 [Proteobacteria bacterium]|nr:hypothetical protein [Pseudomonadota bacterium]
MRVAIPLLGLALLAACGSRSDDVGGVSPDEDHMLNEAAAALDVNYMTAPDNDAGANVADTENAQ